MNKSIGKTVEFICKTLTILLITLIISVVSVLTIPRMFGYDILAVLSGSMEPTYKVGSILYIDKNFQAEDIKVGDVITFKTDNDTIITHRVIDINEDKTFKTKGDNNDIEDMTPIKFEDLLGKVIFTLPLIGYIAINIKTKQGILWIVALFLIVIIIQLIPELLKDEGGEDDVRNDTKV